MIFQLLQEFRNVRSYLEWNLIKLKREHLSMMRKKQINYYLDYFTILLGTDNSIMVSRFNAALNQSFIKIENESFFIHCSIGNNKN